MESAMTATLAAQQALEQSSAAETFGEELFAGAIAAMELATVHLGLRLGLYDALRQTGPATAEELAGHVGLDERYVREWLEQQAMARTLDCVDDAAPAEDRRFVLPPATEAVLLDPGTPAYLGPVAQLAVGIVLAVKDVEVAFATGGGVPFPAYGEELRHGIGQLNGATFDRELAGWVASMPDIDERLRKDERPMVLDVGCGTGRSTLALARAYPRARVHGIDLDSSSIAEARAEAERTGLGNRVGFTVGDAAALMPDRRYDLVMILEALHDMGDPVGALRASRALLRDEGALFIADERTRERYVADGDVVERFNYVCSVLHCLPATLAEDHVVAHGTVLRPETVDAWARQAGFPGVEILDLEDAFWRFYRL
jgi:SAM-dependent methyltransferase